MVFLQNVLLYSSKLVILKYRSITSLRPLIQDQRLLRRDLTRIFCWIARQMNKRRSYWSEKERKSAKRPNSTSFKRQSTRWQVGPITHTVLPPRMGQNALLQLKQLEVRIYEHQWGLKNSLDYVEIIAF